MSRTVLRVALLGGAPWVAAVAAACPVCGGDAGANAQAYLDTMVFLSLFPLAIIGGVAALVWTHAR